MRIRSIALPILALALTAACGETGDAGLPTQPELASTSGHAVLRETEVRYTPPQARLCSSLATEDPNGDWSFPAGNPACLVARVSDRRGAPATGWVRWEVCYDVAKGGGPVVKAACEAGTAVWTTLADWTELVDGETTAMGHASTACDGLRTTAGYRYLFAAGAPGERLPPDLDEPGSRGRVGESDPIDVTSDGTAGGCP